VSARRDALDRFYALLGELERRCGGKRRLAECYGGMGEYLEWHASNAFRG